MWKCFLAMYACNHLYMVIIYSNFQLIILSSYEVMTTYCDPSVLILFCLCLLADGQINNELYIIRSFTMKFTENILYTNSCSKDELHCEQNFSQVLLNFGDVHEFYSYCNPKFEPKRWSEFI